MDSSAGGASGHGGSLPVTAAARRKEWRAVSEHHSSRNAEEMEHSKLGQSDERTIYEVQQGRGSLDLNFCSITIDGTSDNDPLQQRLHNISRQREELLQMEIELKAQLVARSEILEIQNNFDSQLKEQACATLKLQEQLLDKERTVRELERRMEEKDRELRAIKLDNEAAWAKDDLLREQTEKLATFRRERDNSEAEIAKHLHQIHDFQEHIQEKERQFMELQEQHRAAQETILYKDEQLREAQAWIARVQEMEALQSTTNQSLQAELRERTEQYNQLWVGCQRQFAELERLHLHAIQQLQLDLAETRERNGTYVEDSFVSQRNSRDTSQYAQNGRKSDGNGSGTSVVNSGIISDGNADNIQHFISTANTSASNDHASGVPVAPSSIIGLPTFLPPGQLAALHPFVMHQQGPLHSLPSHISRSHVGNFHSVPAVSPPQHWQSQQAVSEGSQMSTENQFLPSQTDQNFLRSDSSYDYEMSVNEQAHHSPYMDVNISQGLESHAQVLEAKNKNYLVSSQPQQSLQQFSSQLNDILRLDPLGQKNETKIVHEHNDVAVTDHGLEGHGLPMEQPSSVVMSQPSDASVHPVNTVELANACVTGDGLPKVYVVSAEQTNSLPAGRTQEPSLLDERSLLAYIVRTIPPGVRIRISSTLPNRLGKMLAPLHWHDYRKKFGKLEEFVAGHPELFVIDGDNIQLREGAQEIIAATAAVAKVAAAAAIPPPYSSSLPSVAVTPMAQHTYRLKKAPAVDSKNGKTAADNCLQRSAIQNQHSNGVLDVAGGITNIRILSKPRGSLELNAPENRPIQSSVVGSAGNGTNPDRPGNGSTQNKMSANGRGGANYVRKQQGQT